MTRKIKYKNLIIFILIIVFIVLLLLKLLSLRISNIYISGNSFLSEQTIIELAKIQNYPSAILTTSNSIESNIKKSNYVSSVNVKKKGFSKVYISVVENRPLFYDEKNSNTILMDGSSTSDSFNIPTLVNSVDSSIYTEFLSQLSLIDLLVYDNISEIEYTPNEVDKKLFLFSMNDGNYVYIDLDRFEDLNRYFDMVINFNNHKGILYLDSGEYFKILDN